MKEGNVTEEKNNDISVIGAVVMRVLKEGTMQRESGDGGTMRGLFSLSDALAALLL